jgi:hypothetical protein
MKALLALTLVVPTVSWAQVQLLPRAVKPAVPDVAQALRGSANPHYLHLPVGTFLYRHLRDTVSHRYAKPLPRGEWSLDVVRSVTARWVAVRWRSGSAQHSLGADTTIYYMPKAALQGAYTSVEI